MLKNCIVSDNMVGGNDSLVFDGSSIVFDGGGRLLARAHSCEEDLVVVDLSMDTKCGTNIAVKIKELHPELRFIVLSVHDEKAIAKKVLDAGSLGYVLKRSTAMDLLPAIDSAMKGEMFISPEIH